MIKLIDTLKPNNCDGLASGLHERKGSLLSTY